MKSSDNAVNILYHDNHLLVLDKPSGMLTQPNETEDLSLQCFGKSWLKNKYQKPGNVFCEAVHRLDRGASGIVLFARTSKALARLQESVREKEWQKIYLAIVEGIMKEEEGKWEDLLLHDEHRAIVSPKGKKSILFFKTLKKSKDKTLVEIDLLTGRYHQIRAQFSTRGYPLLGDQKYGSKLSCKEFALNHMRLSFFHPTTHKKIIIESLSQHLLLNLFS